MKKTVILFVVILSTFNSYSQAPAIEWKKTIGAPNDEQASQLIYTTDGGFVMAGSSSSITNNFSDNHGQYDYAIIKMSALGVVEWQKCYGGSASDFAKSIQQTSDGGYIVAGITTSNDGDVSGNHGSFDYWVIKLDSMGILIWQKAIGGSQDDSASTIRQTADGGYILAGLSNSIDGDHLPTTGNNDKWIVKLNATGDIEWQKSFYTGTGTTVKGVLIELTADGGYIVGCENLSTVGVTVGTTTTFYPDYNVIKLNSLGETMWQKSFGGLHTENLNDIKQTADLGYIIIGTSFSNDGDVTGHHGGTGTTGNSDYWVVKLNAAGDIVWQKSLGGNFNEIGNSIQQTSDGNYILTGSATSNSGDVSGNHGNIDYWVVRLSYLGDILWQKCLGGSNQDFGTSIIQSQDNGYALLGKSLSSNGDVSQNFGNFDFWIVKLAEDLLSNQQFQQEVLLVYPNPVSSLLMVQLPNNALIQKIIITDVTGKVIVQQTQNTTQVMTENLSNGVYFIEAFDGNNTYKSKFIKQ